MLGGGVSSTRLECPHPKGLDSPKHCICPPPTPFFRRSLRLFQQRLVHIFRFPVNLRPAAQLGDSGPRWPGPLLHGIFVCSGLWLWPSGLGPSKDFLSPTPAL